MAALVVLGLGGAALAEPPGSTPPQPPPAPAPELTESYHLQTAAADGIALAAAIAAVTSRNPNGLGTFAAGTYVLGAPIVHFMHRRPMRAIGSLVMRAVIPITLGFAASSGHKNSCSPDSTQCDDYGALGAFVVGGLAGALIVSIVDTAVLAKGDEPPPARSWGPTVGASPGRVTLGIGGSF